MSTKHTRIQLSPPEKISVGPRLNSWLLKFLYRSTLRGAPPPSNLI